PSSAIGTVQIVRWWSDLAEISEAHIDFGLLGSAWSLSAPVDLAQEDRRTLLLGMKTAREYRFRIVATSEQGTCTSQEITIMTGPPPTEPNLPILTKTEARAGVAEGFFVAVPGVSVGNDGGSPDVFIFDSDGDVVWWTPDTLAQVAAAQMSWDGRSMWYVATQSGLLHRTSMDGLSRQSFDVGSAHHDLVPLPEGTMALFANFGSDGPLPLGHHLIEVDDAGALTPIAAMEDLDAP